MSSHSPAGRLARHEVSPPRFVASAGAHVGTVRREELALLDLERRLERELDRLAEERLELDDRRLRLDAAEEALAGLEDRDARGGGAAEAVVEEADLAAAGLGQADRPRDDAAAARGSSSARGWSRPSPGSRSSGSRRSRGGSGSSATGSSCSPASAPTSTIRAGAAAGSASAASTARTTAGRAVRDVLITTQSNTIGRSELRPDESSQLRVQTSIVSIAMASAIEAEGLEREYKGGLKAVDGIDLAVAPGEVYGFLGPNGAGKTTTVRMLVTLLRPTGGVARVAGFDVAREPHEVRRRIGVALQEAALDQLMTGRELMELQATLHGIAPQDVRGRADDLIRRVGLDARPRSAASARTPAACGAASTSRWRSSTSPRSSSSTSRPPASTPVSRLTLWEEVRRLRDEGTTVFLTTQYLEEADVLADRVGDHQRRRDRRRGHAGRPQGAGRRPPPRRHVRRGRRRPRRPRARARGPHRLRRPPPRQRGLPPDDRALRRRPRRRAGRARARRRRLRRRVARARAADARRRLRREDRHATSRARTQDGRPGREPRARPRARPREPAERRAAWSPPASRSRAARCATRSAARSSSRRS